MDFRGILSTSSRRRLILVERLYYTREGIPSEQLLVELACSLPILLNDVKLINEQHTDFFVEKFKGLYRLQVKEKISIGKLYSDVLNQSPEFQIIEQLLYEECDNIIALAERLFLSVSNTQRYLKKIEKILKQAGLYLCYRPLRIEGKESVIRHFYYRYFIEKQHVIEDVLPDLKSYQFISIEQFAVAFIETNQLFKKYILQKRIVYTIYISLWRMKNRHAYPADELREYGLVLPNKHACNDFSNTVHELFHMHLTEEVMKDCLWLLYSDALVFNKKQQASALENNPRYSKLYNIHNELVEEFNHLTGEKLSREQMDYLTTAVLNDCYLYDPNGKYISILSKSRSVFLELASVMYKHVIDKVRAVVENFVAKHEVYQEEDFVKNYVYLLLTSIPETFQLLVEQEKPIHLLLLSDLTPTEEEFLATYIKNNVHGNFEIDHFEVVTNGKNGMYAAMLRYDGLITTGSVKGLPEDFPVVVLDSYITPHKLVDIQNLVNELSVQKNAEFVIN